MRKRPDRRHPGNPAQVRQLIACGADVELGNFVLAGEDKGAVPRESEAAEAVLKEIPGVPHRRWETRMGGWARNYGSDLAVDPPRGTERIAHGPDLKSSRPGWLRSTGLDPQLDPQDVGRRFLVNGGCAYIDLGHLELALPETRSAWDATCAWRAGLRLAESAVRTANAKRPAHAPILLVANNTDGINSWGAHLNFLLRRETYDNLIYRKLHLALYLAAFQASAVVIAGQGSVVGPEAAGSSNAAFVIGQRARFVRRTTGIQTTFDRPMVNLRDEALAEEQRLARLHVIAFDSMLADVARVLTIGGMQLVLAMIDAGVVDTRRLLEDPVHAQHLWNSDPTLRARARTIDGRRYTAVEMQLLFLERAQRFAAERGFDGLVPRAAEILTLWTDTLDKLKRRAFPSLERRLDWVLKLRILKRAMEIDPGLSWGSPEIGMLDVAYANLDQEEGLFWTYERAGAVERLVTDTEIERFVSGPPEDTRAWTRGMLLGRAPGAVASVDWHRMTFRVRGGRRTLDLPDPLSFTRAHTEPLLARHERLDDLLDALGAGPIQTDVSGTAAAPAWGQSGVSGWCH